MKLVGIGLSVLAFCAAAPEAYAETYGPKQRLARFAVGAGFGTAGIEAQAAVRVTKRFAVRAGANILEFDRVEDIDDITYDLDVSATTASVFADLRPFANAFTLTAGGYFGGRRLDLVATPQGNFTIDDIEFTPAQVGDLTGSLDLGSTAPFVGLAFDNTFQGKPGIGVRFGAGVAFGKADVELASSGGLFSAEPILLQAIEQEEASIQDDITLLRFYPVVSLGLTWSF